MEQQIDSGADLEAQGPAESRSSVQAATIETGDGEGGERGQQETQRNPINSSAGKTYQLTS